MRLTLIKAWLRASVQQHVVIELRLYIQWMIFVMRVCQAKSEVFVQRSWSAGYE
jgi:hypothetical protein